jgi:peroxiredoxin
MRITITATRRIERYTERMFRRVLLAIALCSCRRTEASGGNASDGRELIGSPAPAWDVSEWIGTPPLTLASLRGKVVLVRWFMSPDCPYCTATAPALRQLHHDYHDRGLTVVGMYNHTRPEPLDVEKVRGWVHDFKFDFPVAVDPDWRTLRRWWLNSAERDFTSVSFLIDRRGTIRHIHPGGTLAPKTKDFASMRGKIEELLVEPYP